MALGNLIIGIFIGIGVGLFVGISIGYVFGVDKICKQEKQEKSFDARKKEQCIREGFDYEFVETFWYIGVRCKKLEK